MQNSRFNPWHATHDGVCVASSTNVKFRCIASFTPLMLWPTHERGQVSSMRILIPDASSLQGPHPENLTPDLLCHVLDTRASTQSRSVAFAPDGFSQHTGMGFTVHFDES